MSDHIAIGALAVSIVSAVIAGLALYQSHKAYVSSECPQLQLDEWNLTPIGVATELSISKIKNVGQGPAINVRPELSPVSNIDAGVSMTANNPLHLIAPADEKRVEWKGVFYWRNQLQDLILTLTYDDQDGNEYKLLLDLRAFSNTNFQHEGENLAPGLNLKSRRVENSVKKKGLFTKINPKHL